MIIERNFLDPQKFDVPTNDSATPIAEVWGWLLMLDGFPDDIFFVNYSDGVDTWVVSELKTGMAVTKEQGFNKSAAIEFAQKRMEQFKNKWEETKQSARTTLQQYMISYPINEMQHEKEEEK